MKYQVIVEQVDNNTYSAYCPLILSFRSYGNDINSALDKFKQNVLCYLHDYDVVFDITIDEGFARNQDTESRVSQIVNTLRKL